MPYNRFTYDDLTHQINVLSQLGERAIAIGDLEPKLTKASTLIGSRIRTEIERLAALRRKLAADKPLPYDLEPTTMSVVTPTR
jgi:hypothetical protein